MESQPRFPRKWPALGIVLISILLPFFFAAFFISTEEDILSGKLRTAIIIGELFVILPSLLYILRKDLSMQSVYRLRSIRENTWLWCVVIGVSVSVLGDELDRLISLVFDPPEWLTQSMEFFRIDSGLDFIVLIGGVVVVAPITEELLFRGFLQTTLEHRERNVTRAILLTALAFAILHMNTWWVIQIYLFGLVLSYFSWRTQSVAPGMLAHMSINATSVFLGNLHLRDQLEWYELGGHVSPIWIAVSILGIYYGFRQLNAAYPLSSRVSDTIPPQEHTDSGLEEYDSSDMINRQ